MESDPVKLKYPIAALAAALSLSGPAAGLAQDTAAPAPKVTAATPAPKLLVVIAVDQFSADLFAEYRGHFTGGLARLASGVVFPSRSEEHTSELQSLMRISYAVFCLKKKTHQLKQSSITNTNNITL